jgi:hypothetical protein
MREGKEEFQKEKTASYKLDYHGLSGMDFARRPREVRAA